MALLHYPAHRCGIPRHRPHVGRHPGVGHRLSPRPSTRRRWVPFPPSPSSFPSLPSSFPFPSSPSRSGSHRPSPSVVILAVPCFCSCCSRLVHFSSRVILSFTLFVRLELGLGGLPLARMSPTPASAHSPAALGGRNSYSYAGGRGTAARPARRCDCAVLGVWRYPRHPYPAVGMVLPSLIP
jgi:hypothetical protein